MKKLSVIFFLLLVVKSFSQTSDVSVSCGKKAIDKNFLTQEEIVAKEYNFSERIHNFYIDTLSNFLTIKLRGLSKWMNCVLFVVIRKNNYNKFLTERDQKTID